MDIQFTVFTTLPLTSMTQPFSDFYVIFGFL